jgi:hypothetical protein
MIFRLMPSPDYSDVWFIACTVPGAPPFIFGSFPSLATAQAELDRLRLTNSTSKVVRYVPGKENVAQ